MWPEGPKSLKALADYVHGKGMQFGLWFEPEMVNPDSEMFRNHPDWVLKPTANRLPMQGRCQQVVDLTNPEAYDYVYGCMDKLVEELGIDYIKWDHNKLVTEAFSPENARPAVHEQTLAVYRIFRDLKAAHPGLEIESCSSGGGRVDLGILEVADRIWASDCVDPGGARRHPALHVAAGAAGDDRRACGRQPRAFHASQHEPGDAHGHGVLRAYGHRVEPAEGAAGRTWTSWGVWVAEYKRHRADFATRHGGAWRRGRSRGPSGRRGQRRQGPAPCTGSPS